MKHFTVFICLFITSLIMAQSACLPTQIPNVVYFPNTNNTPAAITGSVEYLCGPNTVVNDTIVNSCMIYVNNNCTLTIKPNCSFCPATINVWLKGNSVLNILPGNCNLLEVVYETSATINNPFNVSYMSYSCTTVSFPFVNCNPNGVKTNNLDDENLSLYPNPASDELKISIPSGIEINFNKVLIYNSIGQLIKEEEINFKEKNISIKTNDLKNGIYFLNLSTNKLGNINKQFVIMK